MLDTSIYDNVGKVNLAQGLAQIANNYYQQKNEQADRANKLADLAAQRELQGMQLATAKRKEAQRQQAIQEYNATGTMPVPLDYNVNEVNQMVSGNMPEGTSPAQVQQLQDAMKASGYGQPQQRPLTPEEQQARLIKFGINAPDEAAVPLKMFELKQKYEEARQAAVEKRQAQIEDQRRRQEDRLDYARLAAGLRPEKQVTVMDKNGEGMPYTIPQSQITSEHVLYNPATAKALQQRRSQAEGQQNFNDTIDEITNQYNTLKEHGGITSKTQGALENLRAKASGSVVGQFLGQVGGTENATARDVIRMSRPALMQAIVKASGMSAKQIDSNAELKLMLDQASDPSATYEANMQALSNLKKRFGGSASSTVPNVSATKSGATTSGW